MTRDLFNEPLRRRELLQGGAGLALGLGLAGCGVGNETEVEQEGDREGRSRRSPTATSSTSTGRSTSSRSYQGVREAYGVKVRESNFDSMQAMMAKLRAGNRYDVIFPSVGVGRPAAQGQPAAAHRPGPAPERGERLRLLRQAVVRPEGRPHRPLRDVRQRDHLPRGQDRHERVVERHRPREWAEGTQLPARRLPGGHRRGQPGQRREAQLGRRGGGRQVQAVGARPQAEAARLLDRGRRRTWSTATPGSTTAGTATSSTSATRSRSPRTTRSRSARRASRSAPTASRSPPTPSTRARR